MRIIFCIVISSLIFVNELFAQQEKAFVDQKEFNSELKKVNNSIKYLKSSQSNQNAALKLLEGKIDTIQNALKESENNLQKQVTDVSLNTSDAQNKIAGIGQQIKKKTVQVIIGILLLALLGVSGLFIAITFQRKYTANTANIEKKPYCNARPSGK